MILHPRNSENQTKNITVYKEQEVCASYLVVTRPKCSNNGQKSFRGSIWKTIANISGKNVKHEQCISRQNDDIYTSRRNGDIHISRRDSD